MILSYTEFEGSIRPTVSLQLFFKGKLKTTVTCLLDSGADTTTFPGGLSKAIYGCNFKEMTFDYLKRIGSDRITTNCLCSRQIESIQLPLSVKFDKYDFPLEVNWIVDNKISDNVMPVVGRKGFFELFDITFKQREKKIILTPNVENIRQARNNRDISRTEQTIASLKIK